MSLTIKTQSGIGNFSTNRKYIDKSRNRSSVHPKEETEYHERNTAEVTKDTPPLHEHHEDSLLSLDGMDSILKEVARVQKTRYIPPVMLDTKQGQKACERRFMYHTKVKAADEKVQELIQEGFVKTTTRCDWLIPIHLVPKPGGRWRFCLDLR